jgi:hypothetical protein
MWREYLHTNQSMEYLKERNVGCSIVAFKANLSLRAGIPPLLITKLLGRTDEYINRHIIIK